MSCTSPPSGDADDARRRFDCLTRVLGGEVEAALLGDWVASLVGAVGKGLAMKRLGTLRDRRWRFLTRLHSSSRGVVAGVVALLVSALGEGVVCPLRTWRGDGGDATDADAGADDAARAVAGAPESARVDATAAAPPLASAVDVGEPPVCSSPTR